MAVDDGSILQIGGLSVNTLNGDLVPSTDVSQHKWISLYISSSVYIGTLSFQVSFDNAIWLGCQMYNLTSLDGGDSGFVTQAHPAIVGMPVIAPFFRVRMTSYTSGAATGVLQLYRDGLPGAQLLTTNARLLAAKALIGLTNNDGTSNLAIAAGHVADTPVSLFPGMLSRVLVTATGTNQMMIYDATSGPSGVIIGIIPANPVVGAVYVFKAPANLGIYVAGNANNPGVSIFFAS